MEHTRTIRRIAWGLLLAVVALTALYHLRWLPIKRGDLDPALFSRGIATPLLLWLNGYLATFFNFQYLGVMGALCLVPLIAGIFIWKRLEPWQRGGLAFVWLAVAVIGVFGGFNYRYALTLQPLFTVAGFALAWRIFEGRERSGYIAAMATVCFFSTVLAMEHRQRTWHAEPTFSSPDTKPGTLKERLDQGPQDLDGMLKANGVAPTDTVLVNNLPIWYYVTQRPGVYYWCGSDQLFLADGKPFLFRGRDEEQVDHYLVDSLHCRYIFSTEEYNGYQRAFQDFLDRRTDLLYTDAHGHTLHRVKDTFNR
ncbi:MAG: hypothetical protein IPI07_06230 [Flavobacteriales bacterium]|nr:hypothetical protein [Flavobacteriales bacterium]